ncbi:MAG: hypothetical protein ACJ790_00130 [Myxococcaceae bacterium]
MAPPRPWTVLKHGPLEKHEDNLWSVDGTLPTGHMNRRMSIVRLPDGRLVFHNAVPLDEPAMKELESWGTPTFLIVPTGFHRLDVHAFKQRYSAMKVIAPAKQRARVEQVVAVDGSWDLLPNDPTVKAEVYRGAKVDEAAVIVKSGPRVSFLFADMVMNIPEMAGLDGFMFKLLGSIGGPRVTRIAKFALVGDKKQLKEHLRELGQTPGLSRIIPSHGRNIEGAEAAKAAMEEVVRRL